MPDVSAATLSGLDGAAGDSTFLVNGDTERVIIRGKEGAWSPEFTEGGDVQTLAVGAGGASGPINAGASGGGSGGDVLSSTQSVAVQSYSATVGARGVGTLTGATSGGNTTIFGLTALGGGHGGWSIGTYNVPVDGGGAGQRASGDSRLGAAHPTSFSGGDAFREEGGSLQKYSGGGRGASGNGTDAVDGSFGVGGAGLPSSITGSSVEYGKGGDGNFTGVGGGDAGIAGTLPGEGASGARSFNVADNFSGADGASGAIILRFTLPAAGGETADIALTAVASAMSASGARGASATGQATAQAAQTAADGTRGTEASSAMDAAAGVGVATGLRSSSGETAIQAAPGDLDISAIRSVTAAVADITMTAAAAQVSSAAIRASGLSASAQAASVSAAVTGRRGAGASLALQGSPVTITATGFRTTSVSVTAMAAAGVFYLIESLPVVFGSPQHFITVTRGPYRVTATRG